MDTESAIAVPEPVKPKARTYLKIPFAGGVLRVLPFEGKHAVALALTKHMKNDQGRFNAILKLMSQVVHELDYPDIFDALVERDGEITERDVFKILKDVVDATSKYNAELADQAENTAGG